MANSYATPRPGPTNVQEGGISLNTFEQADKNKDRTILEMAHEIAHGARRVDYGTPLVNHTLTADLFSSYLQARFRNVQTAEGIILNAEDVCFLNVLQKISRAASGNINKDTLVDIAGYTYNIQLIQQERDE